VPANLTPDYFNAEKEYKAAQTDDEKLACLKRMLSIIPKHKGTDKLQADIKRRIAQFKDRLDRKSKKKGPSFRVKPDGAGQIVLAGAPNSGKSALLKAVSHADPEIAAYPFTTREPVPGMMPYKDIQIQLVDLPPLSTEHCEAFVFDNIRGSNGILLLLDLAESDPVDDLEHLTEFLQEKKIFLVPPDHEPKHTFEGDVYLRTILVLTKSDMDPDGELAGLVLEMLETPLPVHAVSAQNGVGLDELRESVFNLLHILRVYTKQPGKPPDLDAPFTTPIGSTVLNLAELVHKDFAKNLKSARIWGSGKFDGQIVQRDHILQDGDVIELSL